MAELVQGIGDAPCRPGGPGQGQRFGQQRLGADQLPPGALDVPQLAEGGELALGVAQLGIASQALLDELTRLPILSFVPLAPRKLEEDARAIPDIAQCSAQLEARGVARVRCCPVPTHAGDVTRAGQGLSHAVTITELLEGRQVGLELGAHR